MPPLPPVMSAIFPSSLPMISPWLSGEGLTVLGDELLERRRLASADLLDHVVRAGKDTVLVIDGDFPQMLGEEGLLGTIAQLPYSMSAGDFPQMLGEEGLPCS